MTEIRRVSELGLEAVGVARAFFVSYRVETGDCRCFQDFDEELRGLPAPYVPPDGQILLASVDQKPMGVVAIKRRSPEVGEIKRLFVCHEARGSGLGRALVSQAFAEARHLGYRGVWLETLETMAPAIRLYRALGMQVVVPAPGAGRAFELDL